MSTFRNWTDGRSKWNKWTSAIGFIAAVALVVGGRSDLWRAAGVVFVALNGYGFWKSRMSR